MTQRFDPTEAQVLMATRLVRNGAKLKEIAFEMRITLHRVNICLNPNVRAKNAAAQRACRNRKNGGKVKLMNRVDGTGPSRISPEGIRARMDEMLAAYHTDNRNLTGRLLGDPLPMRSALNQREASHG